MVQKSKFGKNIKLQQRYDLPNQGKFWSAITQQQIELYSYSNPLKTRKVVV